jgi:TPP-dependent pyruvate/acetoin dehydrogenase alpha subunit
MLSRDRLIAFEHRVADAFAAKQIRAPIHLCSDGQADPLIRIFENIRPQDWVFASWRSHFHALLKGCPEDWVFNEILAGRSMSLINKEHRFICSAIVGGILPIAVGVAMGIQRRIAKAEEYASSRPFGYNAMPLAEREAKVWVFIGDMTNYSGLCAESVRFAAGHCLPLTLVTEDNGFSTDTPTFESWGKSLTPIATSHYKYDRTYPHVGIGQHVEF